MNSSSFLDWNAFACDWLCAMAWGQRQILFYYSMYLFGAMPSKHTSHSSLSIKYLFDTESSSQCWASSTSNWLVCVCVRLSPIYSAQTRTNTPNTIAITSMHSCDECGAQANRIINYVHRKLRKQNQRQSQWQTVMKACARIRLSIDAQRAAHNERHEENCSNSVSWTNWQSAWCLGFSGEN